MLHIATLSYRKALSKQNSFMVGEEIDCLPSRFLDELPEEDLVWEGRGDETESVKKERGKASLSALKAMLND